MNSDKKLNIALKTHQDRSNIYWELFSEKELDDEAIALAQTKAGYIPAGYGGPNRLKIEKTSDGLFVHTWSCFASCD